MAYNAGIAARFNGGNTLLIKIIPSQIFPAVAIVPINVFGPRETGRKF